MSRLVVDTSVAVKWFLEEPFAEQAREILNGNNTLLAPDLLIAEFGSVLWKRVRAGEMTEDEAAAAVRAFLEIPLRLYPTTELIQPALEIANRTQRTVYDSLYLALAIAEKARMVTADSRLFNALQDTPLTKHIVWVGGLMVNG